MDNSAPRPEFRVGNFVLTSSYADEEDKIAIYRYNDGEGGDFDKAGLEAVIAKFYEDYF